MILIVAENNVGTILPATHNPLADEASDRPVRTRLQAAGGCN